MSTETLNEADDPVEKFVAEWSYVCIGNREIPSFRQDVRDLWVEAQAQARSPARQGSGGTSGAAAEGWLVAVCTLVEIADQRVEQDFDSKTVTLRVGDWNQIVGAARGQVSNAAEHRIERFRAQAFLDATKARNLLKGGDTDGS